MSWIYITIVAQFFLGTAAVFDKILLKRSYANPVSYVFGLAVLGLAGLFLIPFGLESLQLKYILLSLLAGGIFIGGMYFYFAALSRGHASDIIVLMGAILPLCSFFFSKQILDWQLSSFQALAFSLVVLGSIILFYSERRELRLSSFALALASGLLLGLYSNIAKVVFLHTNFITGFIWIKIGGAVLASSLLLISKWRVKVFESFSNQGAERKILYTLNRAYAGAGSVLLAYGLTFALPPLIDATYNLQIIFAGIAAWFLLKEHHRGWSLWGKLIATAIIAAGILLLAAGSYLDMTRPPADRSIKWGATFSQKFAQEMGLDWREAYDAVITDLGVRDLRLAAYWDLIQPEPGQYNFSDIDYQLNKAQIYKTNIILTVGLKVPRWPECHLPEWAAGLNQSDREEVFVEYLKTIVGRYKSSPALRYWQISNEPFLPFGECQELSADFLDKEIKLVKEIDPAHLVLMTDSGEIGRWAKAAERGDVFGTTMYRRVHNDKFGNIDYHLPPEFFRLKEKITRWRIGDYSKRFIVIELGAEPWLKHQLYETSLEDQFEVFDLAFFKDTIRYARETGFDEYYLWGTEWWYWLKEKQNHPEFWEYARTLYNN